MTRTLKCDVATSRFPDRIEYRRKSDNKLLATVPLAHSELDVAATAYDVGLTEGMELGRRQLQGELKDLLGIE